MSERPPARRAADHAGRASRACTREGTGAAPANTGGHHTQAHTQAQAGTAAHWRQISRTASQAGTARHPQTGAERPPTQRQQADTRPDPRHPRPQSQKSNQTRPPAHTPARKITARTRERYWQIGGQVLRVRKRKIFLGEGAKKRFRGLARGIGGG